MRKSYSIAEALKILDIGRDQLFYWIKTKRLIKMEVEGKGRGARSKLSDKNLFELAVIKELASIGIELNVIDQILNEQEKFRVKTSEDEFKFKSYNRYLDYVFDSYYRKTSAYYGKTGAFVEKEEGQIVNIYIQLFKNEKNEFEYHIDEEREADKEMRYDFRDYFMISRAVIVISLFDVLRRLERKIGKEK